MFDFIKGNIFIVIVTNIIWFFVLTMANTYFSLYVISLGGSMVVIGVVNALNSLSSLFIYPIAGQVADSIDRVKVIGIARIFRYSTYFFHILALGWTTLATGVFIQGLIIFHFPATSALIADSLHPERRGIGYATLHAVPGAIAILAPYVAALVVTRYGINLGMRFLYSAVLAGGITVSLVQFKFLKEPFKRSGSIKLRDAKSMFKSSYSSVWETLKWMPKSLRFVALILALSLFFNAVTGPFWVVYGVNEIELTTLEWGLIMLSMSVLRVGLSIPAGMLIDRFGKRRTLITALAFSVIPVSLFVYCKTFLQTFTVLLMIPISNAFLMPACSSLLADIVPRVRRGRIMAALGQGGFFIRAQGGLTGGPGLGFVLTLPVILGSLIGGYIYSFNPVLPWILFSMALISCLIFTILFILEPEKPEL